MGRSRIENPFDEARSRERRSELRDLMLAALCVLSFFLSVWWVIDAVGASSEARRERHDLLMEFEELRVATDCALDLEALSREERMQEVRDRLEHLRLRWSRVAPVPDSEPRLLRVGDRELLVLSTAPNQAGSVAGSPPR